MEERSELVVFFVLALVGISIFVTLGTSLSTDVPVSHGKTDARATATEFLQSQGFDVSDYTINTVFESHEDTGTYLQRKLPEGQATEAIQTYSVFVWEVRFYQPLNQTEFFVDIDPITGQVVGFTRHVPDEASGTRLSKDAARSKARSFLITRGYDLPAYEPIRNASTDRANRRDHDFVWKKRDGGVANASEKVEVEIQGDRVGSYSEFLDVPDGFQHQFETIQDRNNLFGTIGSFFLVLIVLLAVGFAVRYYRRGQFDVRLGLIVGGTIAVVLFGQELNSLPGTLHRMPTTTTTLQYLAQNLISALIGAVLLGVVVGVLFGAGIRIAQDYLGKSLIGNADPETTVRTLKYSTLRGFFVGWIMLGYVVVFYWLGSRYFDVWLPVSTPYTDAMSTFLPAFSVLLVGLLAAVMEELVFRVIGISVGTRYVRYSAVAVVLTALIWAVGHSQYVVMPPYARFVELTIVGIVAGWLFLRYDFMTVLGYHFTYNASVTAVPMLLANLPFVIANGVVGIMIAGLPLFVGVGTIGYDRMAPGDLEERLTPEQVPTETVLNLLETTDEHVLTTAEVAEELGVSHEIARTELETLFDQGEINKKDIRGDAAVWWV